jgi:hypothetical protein
MTKSMHLNFGIVHAQSPSSFNASDCPPMRVAVLLRRHE